MPFTTQRQNTLSPNHAPELVNYLLPPRLKQACTVRGLEDTCSSQHCLHKAIWLPRPAEDIAEELLGNLPILSFFVNQHVLQLPPSPLFAFHRPKEPSPTPALQLREPLTLRCCSYPWSCCWVTRRMTPGTPHQAGNPGSGPVTYMHYGKDAGARKAWSTQAGHLQESKGLEAVGV